jgi:hypothetical protein
VCSNIGEEITELEELMRKRQTIHSLHLLELVQIKRVEEKNVCSVINKMHILIDYPFKTLQDEVNDRIAGGRNKPFLEAELWSVLYSCSVGLSVLYGRKMPHECLTGSEIFISRDGLIKISDPLLLGLEKNYIRILKRDAEHVHIPPEILNFLDDCNFSFYDK